MTKPTLLIIGGGIVGRAIAWKAAAQFQVTLVTDDRPGATMAAAGMLAPSFECLHHRFVESVEPILFRSLSMWDEFAGDLGQVSGVSFDYRRNGIVGLGFNPEELPQAVLASAPPGFEFDKGLLVEGEGQVDPRLVIRALKRISNDGGYHEVAGRVTELVRYEHQCVSAVLADGTILDADQFLVATGAACELLPHMEVHMMPIRGRAYEVKLDHPGFERVVRTRDTYLCPKTDGVVYLGATEESSTDDAGQIEELWERGVSLFPALRRGDILRVFDGIRPAIAGGRPIVAYDERSSNVLVAMGHDRNGVLLTPWVTNQAISLLSEKA